MPVCDTADHIQQYLQAVVRKDADMLAEVGKSCPTVDGGLMVTVVEDLPGSSELSHFVKIEIIGEKSGLTRGYSLRIGLKGSP